jgi:large subunit ribosomal protein L9
MRVVLRSDVSGVGKRGDIVDVADGFARNHLLPTGSAIVATDGVQAQAAAMRRARDLKDTKDREAAEVIAQRLVPLTIAISARAGREGKLFGSVTTTDVVEAVADQAGVTIDRHVLLAHDPIKELGRHEIGVRLHPEVEFSLAVEVVASQH